MIPNAPPAILAEPAPLPAEASERSPDADPRCMRCGYSLIGLDARRPCPECGLLVGLSLLDGHELRQNRPRWLAALSAGAASLALGMLSFPAIAVSAELMLEGVRRNLVLPGAGGPVIDWQVWGTGLTLGLGQTVPIAVGVWLLTRPAMRARLDERARNSRLALRLMAMFPLILVAAWALAGANLLGRAFDLRRWAYSEVAMAALLVWGAVMAAWLFQYLKSLALRAPAPLLAADSPVVGFVLGACLLVPLLVLAVASLGLVFDPNTGAGMLVMILVVCIVAVGLTAWLWSIYLLIRYAVAFGRTARQARQLMADFDASRNPAAVAYDSPL